MTGRRQILITAATTALLSCGLLGAKCGGDDPTSSSTPSPTASATPTQAPPGSSGPGINNGFYIQAQPATGVATYTHEQSSFSNPCSVSPGQTDPTKNDIFCILDVAELDLYFHGMTLNYNVPPSMCQYAIVHSYWFWEYKPGAPSNVGYCVDSVSQKVISVQAAGGGTVSATGTYTCPFDYSAGGGPNCCEGSYTQTVETSVAGAACGNPVVGTASYGGKASACIGGPAPDLPGVLISKEGFPGGYYFDARASGVNQTLVIASPNAKTFNTNLYAANYYNPADHAGGLPLAMQAIPAFGFPSPYYELDCMDPADDPIARIRLMIRSWDTVAGFTAQSNPYTVGNDPNFGGSHPWHDSGVWKDYVGVYPDGI